MKLNAAETAKVRRGKTYLKVIRTMKPNETTQISIGILQGFKFWTRIKILFGYKLSFKGCVELKQTKGEKMKANMTYWKGTPKKAAAGKRSPLPWPLHMTTWSISTFTATHTIDTKPKSKKKVKL